MDACEKTAGDKEEIYAMSFRMHCDAEDADWRYMCEIIVQTKENCIGSMEKNTYRRNISILKIIWTRFARHRNICWKIVLIWMNVMR